MMSKLPDELAIVLGRQFGAFTEKFGRKPGRGDPLFFDPDVATPTVISETKFEAQIRETCEAIDVPFENVTYLLESNVRSARWQSSYWQFLDQFKEITGMSGVEAKAYIEARQRAEDEFHTNPRVNELAHKIRIALEEGEDDEGGTSVH
jgi:hypothetical protein